MTKGERKGWLQAGRMLGLAFLLPCATFVGYALGFMLDKKLGTSYCAMVGLLLGIVGGMVQLIREISKEK